MDTTSQTSNGGENEQRKSPPPRRHHRPDQEEEKKDASSPVLATRNKFVTDNQSVLSSSTTESTAARLLDKQIAGQRQRGQLSSDSASKQKAKAARSAPGSYRKPPPPSGSKPPTFSDQDAIAKSRARRGAVGQYQLQKPLPTHLKSSSSGGNVRCSVKNTTKLERLEEEVAAKARGRVSIHATKRTPAVASSDSNSSLGTSFTAVKRMNRMEADIAAKEEARASRHAGNLRESSGRTIAPKTSVNRLDRLEADVAAKARAKASRPNAKSKSDRIAEDVDSDAQLKKKKTINSPSNVSGTKVTKAKKSSPSPATCVVGGNKQEKIRNKDLQTGGNGKVVDIENNDSMDPDGENFHDNNVGLAVAVAVTEDDNENVFIPSAIEYDPDAKRPLYKNQRLRVYGLLGCTLVIILVACAIGVLAILQREQRMNDLFPPTESPTCARCTRDFIEQLELEVGSQILNDPTSPEFMAKEWIIHDDPAQLNPSDNNFIQRFLMAAFYFDTHQVDEWRSCNRPDYTVPNATDDCDFEKIARIEPLEYELYPAKRWLSAVGECDWAGVSCDELEQLRLIDLHGQEIQGTFPESFKRLRYVQTVAMQWNKFTGSLPESFGQMKHLIHVELQHNEFTGSIPSSWSSARNLQLLNVAGNYITGQIPPEVGNFRNIKGFFVYKTNISGTLPQELSNAKSLGFMRFQKNNFMGTIPSEYGGMQLNELWLHGNSRLTGTIPPQLGKLSNYLTDIRLSETSLEGTLPAELYDLSNLWRLDLYQAGFTGTISRNITKLGGLRKLRISDNKLSGTVPSEIALLTNLDTLWLENNEFTGAIPMAICDLKEDHVLSYIKADCLPDPSTGVPLISCECCDVCCNGEECEVSDIEN